MGLFKKRKKPEPIISKFQVGEFVQFRYQDSLHPGYVYSVSKNENEEIVYEIQIGGECPAIIKNIHENEVKIGPKRNW